MKLSIIVPAYNEARFIESTLGTILAYLTNSGGLEETEVIVVAATGTDKTAELAKKAGESFKHFKVIEPGPRVGKGRDVKLGMLEATGKYMLFTDADLATPIHNVAKAIKALDNGADVVIGSRNLASMHNTFFRRLTSQMSNLLIRSMIAPDLNDTQCGFKAFKSAPGKKIFQDLTVMGWGFDFEVIAISRKQGFKLTEVPIPDWHDPKGEDGLVGDNAIIAMLKTLRELFSVKIKMIKGDYS